MATKNKPLVSYVANDLQDFVSSFNNKSQIVNYLLRKLMNDKNLQKELTMVYGIQFNTNKESDK